MKIGKMVRDTTDIQTHFLYLGIGTTHLHYYPFRIKTKHYMVTPIEPILFHPILFCTRIKVVQCDAVCLALQHNLIFMCIFYVPGTEFSTLRALPTCQRYHCWQSQSSPGCVTFACFSLNIVINFFSTKDPFIRIVWTSTLKSNIVLSQTAKSMNQANNKLPLVQPVQGCREKKQSLSIIKINHDTAHGQTWKSSCLHVQSHSTDFINALLYSCETIS